MMNMRGTASRLCRVASWLLALVVASFAQETSDDRAWTKWAALVLLVLAALFNAARPSRVNPTPSAYMFAAAFYVAIIGVVALVVPLPAVAAMSLGAAAFLAVVALAVNF